MDTAATGSSSFGVSWSSAQENQVWAVTHTTPHHTSHHTTHHTTPHTSPHHTTLYCTTHHTATLDHTTPHHIHTYIRTYHSFIHCSTLVKLPYKVYSTQHTTLHYTIPHPTPHYTTLHYTTLHYTTLHYTTPHPTLHHTTLHYTTLHYTAHHTTLHYTTLHYTTLHYTTQHTTPHYTIPPHTPHTAHFTAPPHPTTPHPPLRSRKRVGTLSSTPGSRSHLVGAPGSPLPARGFNTADLSHCRRVHWSTRSSWRSISTWEWSEQRGGREETLHASVISGDLLRVCHSV